MKVVLIIVLTIVAFSFTLGGGFAIITDLTNVDLGRPRQYGIFQYISSFWFFMYAIAMKLILDD